ncbi:hypothetical protein [Caldimonas brevitalea]|nr:hypothetical protein [Caldimonas brevitalea]
MSVSLDLQRQTAHQRFLAEGHDLVFGDAADCPLPPVRLAQLTPTSPEVLRSCEEGLTARVYCVEGARGRYAVKQARESCLVQNPDGQTSFINELCRHREIREQRRLEPDRFPGVVAPLYGSLREGLIVSPWIDGERVDDWTERRLLQVFETGRALLEHGFFEWDYSPGNVLDDGQQVWLFDFGYQYRFDPLTQFNSAGHGDDQPMFHLAERLETRNLFAWLLKLEGAGQMPLALARFRLTKEIAVETYQHLRATLAARGAKPHVLDWLSGIVAEWQQALRGDLGVLYLREGWRSHVLDLDDDLRGRTCTPSTLARCDWLLAALQAEGETLQRVGAFFGEDRDLTRAQRRQRYEALRREAERYQISP